jgi:hypothetical protein
LDSNLAQKYWDTANAIVAFSVLQMLAFLYALANKDFRAQVERAFCLVIAAIVVSSLLYTVGVVGCYFAERNLRSMEIGPNVGRLILITLFARILIIAVYTVFGIATLLVFKGRGSG